MDYDPSLFQGRYGESLKYDVDMVFCIDATGSMSPIINNVKQNALSLYDQIVQAMDEKGKKIDSLRVRLVIFRDYYADTKANAMTVTPFFNLPEENSSFKAHVDSIVADGGGDPPEDGLEALAYAIHSDWKETTSKGRQIIVLWTDTTAHPLGEGPKMDMPDYPAQMPRTYAELSEMWDEMDDSKKNLIMFAPNEGYWSQIYNDWERVVLAGSKAGMGLSEVTFSQIIDYITSSISG